MSIFDDHPILPCGYNSAPHDGDEIDGAGYNEPIWPMYCMDCFEAYQPIIMTNALADIFANECPDIVFNCENNTITFPCPNNVYLVREPVKEVA